jgi:hypothetical protein
MVLGDLIIVFGRDEDARNSQGKGIYLVDPKVPDRLGTRGRGLDIPIFWQGFQRDSPYLRLRLARQ